MARIRVLNPEFWLDEEIATVSPHARLLYMGLWGICDDNYATFPNKPKWLKIQVFPFEEVDIPRLLDELSSIGKIVSFKSKGEDFWWIKNFLKHQRIDRPSKPKYPRYSKTLDEYSTTTRSEDKIREEELREDKPSLKDYKPDFLKRKI